MTVELIKNLARLRTTELGVVRIKRNLGLEVTDVVAWCMGEIENTKSLITRKGKNWYITTSECVITVNAHSYTIITAHKM